MIEAVAAPLPKNLPPVGFRAPPGNPAVGVIDLCDYAPDAWKLLLLLYWDLTKPGGAKGRPLADMAAG